jgi:hypothetical protein
MDMNNITGEHNPDGDQQPAGMAPTEETLGRDAAIVLFGIAFVFRLIYIVQSTDNPLFGYPVVDAWKMAVGPRWQLSSDLSCFSCTTANHPW